RLLTRPGAAMAQSAEEADASVVPGRMVTTSFELDSEGAVQDCTVTVPGGIRELDKLSCRLVYQQSKYELERDEEGKAIPATIIHTLNFSPTDDRQIAARQTDMPLQP